MKIEKIEAIALSVKLPRDFRGSIYSVPQKNAVVTRIHTDEGLIGHCVNGEGEAAIQPQMVQIIDKEIAPLLIGQDPTRIEAHWDAIWRRATWRGGRDIRTAVRAVACVDSALWDILGKVANLPLYKLWGGARDRLPIIAIGGQYHDDYQPADYGREMEEFRELGLAGCKFKVGGKSPAEDYERTVAARKAGGEDFVLCVDANRGWSAQDAITFARLIEPLNIAWFEEPCLWHDDAAMMARVRKSIRMPVTAGQSEITCQGVRRLLDAGAVDYVNYDVSEGGGVTDWRRVAGLCAASGVRMAHHEEAQIASQLLSAVPHGTYAE